MFGLGTQEIILILIVVLVIFGAGKLPQIGESMGKAIRNFKSAAKDEDAIDITPKKDAENKENKPNQNQQ
ncbi:MAG: twin-arginine translocase TatA/TatE family subunit [Deferribacterales bacterium]